MENKIHRTPSKGLSVSGARRFVLQAISGIAANVPLFMIAREWRMNVEENLNQRAYEAIFKSGLENYYESLQLVPRVIKDSLVALEFGKNEPAKSGNGTVLNIFKGHTQKYFMSVLTSAHIIKASRSNQLPNLRISKLLGDLARYSCSGFTGYTNAEMGGDTRDLGVMMCELGTDLQGGHIQENFFGQYLQERGKFVHLENATKEELINMTNSTTSVENVPWKPGDIKILEQMGINYDLTESGVLLVPRTVTFPNLQKTVSRSLFLSDSAQIKSSMSGSPVHDQEGTIAGLIAQIDLDLADITTMHPEVDGGKVCAIPVDFPKNYQRLLHGYMFNK